MDKILSVCGLLCNECQYLNNCQGCHIVKGSTFWAKDIMPDKICPLYTCAVVENRYDNCGQCGKLPCGKFNDLKDPNISEEQHKKSIEERAARLKNSITHGHR